MPITVPECQNALIAAVSAVQPNTVVVLHNGSAVECPWADSVGAVPEMYLGGQGVGEACDRLLWGEENPCSRLAETFPLRLQDTPSYLNFPGDGKKVHYAEDVYVGYRWYDSREIPVRWAFGHGLSYTTFEYSDLKLSAGEMGDEDTVLVSVKVTNTGAVAGKEVVQLYISDRNGTPGRPAKELKGFCKVELAPGESKIACMTITARDLSFWQETLGDWYAPSGQYAILVGHASDDIRLRTELHFTTRKLLPLVVDNATTIGELMADPRTAPMVQQMQAQMGEGMLDMNDPGVSAMMEAMMRGLPLKSLITFGMMQPERVEGLIHALNTQIQG